MAWGEIKKSLNSTLGTSNFKSLDEIIEGTKGLCACDIPVAVLHIGEENQGTGTAKTVGTFTPKKSGTARVLVVGRVSAPGEFDEHYKGGIRIYNSSNVLVGENSSALEDYNTISVDFNITANETYTIKVFSIVNFFRYKLVEVCVGITDTSLYDYTVVQ